jgi:hypothetical protein
VCLALIVHFLCNCSPATCPPPASKQQKVILLLHLPQTKQNAAAAAVSLAHSSIL